jgi:hypothetical protein
MLSALRKDEHYKQWLKAGGRYADFLALDRTDLNKTLEQVVEPRWRSFVKQWKNPITGGIQTLRMVSELMEMATRLQEFKLAKAKGATDIEAANASKDVVLNYARFGFRGKAVNQLSAFFNAKVQDWDKFGREHSGPNRLSTMAKGMMWITAPSLLLWWVGKDDEEIKEMAPWRKIGFWNLNLRPIAKAAGLDTDNESLPWGDWIVSLPKPFLVGYLYGSAPEAALDAVYKDDPAAVWDFFKSVSRETPLPLNLDSDQYFAQMSLAPTVARPVIEAVGNINLHTNAPLENEAQREYERWLRASPQTSELMKYLAEKGMVYTDGALNASPIVMDNFVRAYTGGLGNYGMDFVDALMSYVGLVDVPVRPATQWSDLPGLKAFLKNKFEPADTVRQFHEGLQKAEQRINTFRAVTEIDKPKTWYRDRYGELVSHYLWTGPVDPSIPLDQAVTPLKRLRHAQDQLSQIQKSVDQVMKATQMTREEKLFEVMQLLNERNNVARDALQYLHPKDRQSVKR